jgi:carbonic anhydrase
MNMPMRDLLLGLLEFNEQSRPLNLERLRVLSEAPTPAALIIACADSRVIPGLLAFVAAGELFMIRNVGNLIPPAREEGTSSGAWSEASAIEYAVGILGIRNVVVCGHSNCGAMRVVISGSYLDDTPTLRAWLDHARPTPGMANLVAKSTTGRPADDELSQSNVLLQLQHLFSYPAINKRLTDGTLSVAGWWFDIATGEMHIYDPTTRRFELLTRQMMDRVAD